MISGGQVGPSALLGGGIGLAVGATGAVTYRHLKREERIQQGNAIISNQQATIEQNQQDIESMRSNLADEASALNEATGSQILPFQGVTVNNPY
jgi:hypothetical protein